MEFTKVVESRHSCKCYDGRGASQEQLDRIFAAGKCAPTAKNLQEHHVYVLQSEEMLAKIDGLTRCRYNAGTVLVVTFDKENVYTYPGSDRQSGVEDATIVATHLLLAATNEGLDTCWVNCFNPDEMKAMLNLPENEEVLMMLDIGYMAEGAPMNPQHALRKDLSETVTYL